MIKLSTLMLENIQAYLSSLRKKQRELINFIYTKNKSLSPEEYNKIYKKILNLGDKIQKLSIGNEHEKEKDIFLKSQQSDNIPSDVYDNYKKTGGLSWLGSKTKYPLLLSTEVFDKYTVEFRQQDEDLKYVKIDDNHNIVRNKDGNAVYMTKDEMIEKNLPLKCTDIVAFINDEPIGLASNELGAVGIWVEQRYQGLGIGTALLEKHIEQRPDIQSKHNKIGQMTHAGEGMTKAYYDLMVKKHGKNWWYYTNNPKK